jgi:hypothetical protein
MAPSYLRELITPYAPSKTLRSSDQSRLQVSFTTSSVILTQAFSAAGQKLWNDLPREIRTANSLCIFKAKCVYSPFISTSLCIFATMNPNNVCFNFHN